MRSNRQFSGGFCAFTDMQTLSSVPSHLAIKFIHSHANKSARLPQNTIFPANETVFVCHLSENGNAIITETEFVKICRKLSVVSDS